MTTKLQEEVAALKGAVQNAADEVNARAPHWLLNILDNLIYDERTAWFCCGMAVEALGISAQVLFRIPAYPILDFIVAIVIFFGLLFIQRDTDVEQDHAEDVRE